MLGHIEDKRRKLLLLEKSLLNALCAAFDPFEICARSCSRHRVYNHSTQHARTCLFFESRFEPGSSSTHWKGQMSSMATRD